ncbi:MAG: hypothetical protein ACXV8K_13340, partial [Ilumatobacteraceae bacterium]
MRAKWGTSVRSRATSWASVVLALALVVGALAAAGQLRRALASDEASLLDDRVDEVEALVRAGALTSVLAPTGREVGQVQVVDSSGTVEAVTPGLAVST